jgi:DnaJ-class molecular chaperone
MKNNKEETFYDILGLDEKCAPEDIKKAYRKLSFMHHPDKNGNSQESTEKFQKISEAFSILSDPNERVKYDANRNNPFINIGGNAGMGGGGGIRINPMDIFNMFMGGRGGLGGLGGGGGGGMGGPRIIIRTFGPGGVNQFEEVVSDSMMGGIGGGGDPFSALFNEINRDMRAHMHPHIQHHHQSHPHPQMHNMHTTQEMHKDTHTHTHMHTQIPRTPRFGNGNGNGNANQKPVSKPSLISVNVNVSLEDIACGNTIPIEIERWNLNREDNESYELEKHIEYYSLPFGVESGEVVLLTNCGNESANNMRGDVKVTFHVAEHDVFRRNGLDIHTEKTISLKEALCGFVFNIEHVNGKKFAFNSSSGNIIRDGLIKTIPKLGIRRGDEVGSLNIVFHVAYPEKLSEEQVKKISEIL